MIMLQHDTPTDEFRQIVYILDNAMVKLEVQELLRRLIVDSEAELQKRPETFVVIKPFKLSTLGIPLPEGVRSCRFSLFRASATCRIERHPNSTQYVLAVAGEGLVRVFRNFEWQADSYGAFAEGTLEMRWHVVPAGVWHQPVPSPKSNWAVLGFHSAEKVQDEFME